MKEKILQELKQSQGKYVSGGKLARALKVSRTAIWKQIKSLKKMGYEIEAKPKKGYRLLKSPDLITPEEIKIGLKTAIIGRELSYFQSVSSTNDVAKELAEKGASEGLVVLAESQSMGRGRLGRTWASPPGGIWLSVILRPEILPSNAHLLAIAAGVGAANAINKLGLHAKLKWPNDVMIRDKKVCGILLELAAEVEAVDYAILGIGINANNDLPMEIQKIATTLKKELGNVIERAKFVQELLLELEEKYFLFKRDPSLILNRWRALSSILGEKVQIKTQNENFTGIARDIASNGSLLVELEDGSIKQVIAGDCLNLRSALENSFSPC
ncbi:MAG: biotin--[acetyl-CoA-carboxylase] ligase [Halobacteria archaeon]